MTKTLPNTIDKENIPSLGLDKPSTITPLKSLGKPRALSASLKLAKAVSKKAFGLQVKLETISAEEVEKLTKNQMISALVSYYRNSGKLVVTTDFEQKPETLLRKEIR